MFLLQVSYIFLSQHSSRSGQQLRSGLSIVYSLTSIPILHTTTHDNMDGSETSRRDSMNSPPMAPPPPPSAQRQRQRTYARCNGQVLPESQFQQLFSHAMTTKKQGGNVPQHLQHEIMWMLSQHHPNHKLLGGKRVPPPAHADPKVLQRMGYSAQICQQQQQRQQLQRQQQQQQQRPPNAMSPNMIPSDSVIAARRAGTPMTIDPSLANASTGVGPQVRGPSVQTSSQRPQGTGFLPAQSSPLMTPTGPMDSPLGRPASRASAIAPYGHGLGSSAQPSLVQMERSHGARSPPALHHNPIPQSPSQFSPSRAQAARPSGTSPYPSPALTLSSSKRSPPTPSKMPQGPAPRLGVFYPPDPQTAGVQRNVSQPQHNKQGNPQAEAKVNNEGDRLPTDVADKDVQPKSRAQHVISLDQMVAIALQNLQMFHPQHYSQTAAWLGRNPSKEKKESILQQLKEFKQARAEKRARLQQHRPSSASQQGEVIDLTRRKRKEPPTAAHQPRSKRQLIDLTEDEPPRKQVARREQLAQREPQPPVALTTIGGFEIDVVPIPEHIATDNLRAHALIHGVNIHDVELNDTIYHDQMAHISQHSSQQDAISRLDPSSQALRRMKKANLEQKLPIYEAEPSIAAAARKVKSGRFDFSWSAENEKLLAPVPDEEFIRMGCTRDEDGLWRGPSLLIITEERANVEWELVGQGHRDCVS